jgi:hypothetical protein
MISSHPIQPKKLFKLALVLARFAPFFCLAVIAVAPIVVTNSI